MEGALRLIDEVGNGKFNVKKQPCYATNRSKATHTVDLWRAGVRAAFKDAIARMNGARVVEVSELPGAAPAGTPGVAVGPDNDDMPPPSDDDDDDNVSVGSKRAGDLSLVRAKHACLRMEIERPRLVAEAAAEAQRVDVAAILERERIDPVFKEQRALTALKLAQEAQAIKLAMKAAEGPSPEELAAAEAARDKAKEEAADAAKAEARERSLAIAAALRRFFDAPDGERPALRGAIRLELDALLGTSIPDATARTRRIAGMMRITRKKGVVLRRTVYVLSNAEETIWYVGEAAAAQARIAEHLSGGARCAAWVRRHHLTKVHAPLTPPMENSKLWETAELFARMARHGVANVRGAQYSEPDMSPETQREAMRACLHAEGLCNRCGHAGHFIGQCFARTYGPVAGGGPFVGPLTA